MNKARLSKILTVLIAMVWLINGLFCKLLILVPRHQQIVSKILGEEYASVITKMIGISEVLMAMWILSAYKKKFNAIVQIVIIAAMNILEFFLAPDLLLFGKMNLIFAILLCITIYITVFNLNVDSLEVT